MKHGSTGTHQKPRSSRNSELHPANVLWRWQRLSYQPERWWPPFSGIHKVWSTLITWRRANGHRALLCWIIGPIRCRVAEKFGEEKSALPPWQHTGSHLRRRHGQIGQIALRTAAPSTVFFKFGPVRLFLFPNLKKSLAGQKFESSEEVIAATETYFADLKKTYFSDGLKKFEHCWVKCIKLKGDCVEK